MFGEILGLPLHPLVVHGFVVIGPLVAIATVVYAVWRRSRRVLRWPVLVGLVVSLVLAIFTRQSGENLRDRLYPMLSTGGTPVPGSESVWLHTQLAGIAGIVAAIWAVLAIALVWFVARPMGARGWLGRVDMHGEDARGKRPLTVIDVVWAGVLAAISIVALVWMIIAGHSGTTASWGNMFG
ncbi:MAG: hypothetical protein ACTH31_15425 [Pseudoclavibacter sp.]